MGHKEHYASKIYWGKDIMLKVIEVSFPSQKRTISYFKGYRHLFTIRSGKSAF